MSILYITESAGTNRVPTMLCAHNALGTRLKRLPLVPVLTNSQVKALFFDWNNYSKAAVLPPTEGTAKLIQG